MKLTCEDKKYGLNVKFKRKNYKLKYPVKIWNKLPEKLKKPLIDNLIYISTVNVPLVAGFDEINFNTSLPLFKKQFDNMIMGGIPGGVADHPEQSARNFIKKFRKIKYNFQNKKIKLPFYDKNLQERAVVSFSSGKDSILSTAICNEIGLNPVIVYINDTVSPGENSTKKRFLKKISKEMKLDSVLVTNQIEKLNDFETWKKPVTATNYSHMLTNFCLTNIPINNYFNSKYIVLGNEQDLNHYVIDKEGYRAYISFDQTEDSTNKQNEIVKTLTNNKMNVISVIRPLTNLALFKVLFNRYPEYTKYMTSCDSLDASNEKRWCHECNTCLAWYLFIKTVGGNVKQAGFKKDLLNKKYKFGYTLFGENIDLYERSQHSKDEQLLTFYLAHKNGVKGDLIDIFKKTYLQEAKSREDELIKRFFKLYPTKNMPNNISKQVLSIYKEELKN